MSDQWDDINLSIHNAIVTMGTFQTPLDDDLVGITLGEWQLEQARRIRQVMEQYLAELRAELLAAQELHLADEADVYSLTAEIAELRRLGEYSGPLSYYIPLVARLEAEVAALRTQLAATWQPVNGDESERIMCACPDEGCYKAVEWDGTNLTIYVDVSEFDAGLPSLFTMIDLPDNVRLCRTQPAPVQP